MDTFLSKGKIWLICSLVLTLTACQSTQITNIWSEIPAKPFKSMMVMAAYSEENVRRTIEDKVVKTLEGSGVSALAFYRLYPAVQNLQEPKLRTLVKNSKVQSVLTIRQIHLEQRIRIQSMPSFYGYGQFYRNGWYGTEPIAIPYTVAILEINLWDTQTGKLVWSASSEAMNPNQIGSTAKSLAQTTVKALQKQGWIMTGNKNH